MSRKQPRHRQVREALAERIAKGEISPGERLAPERALQHEFECARSVIRQALTALTRDGWIVSDYPRGHVVLGPRIPWLSRLRLLSQKPWAVTIDAVAERGAPLDTSEALLIRPGAPVIVRNSRLGSRDGSEVWGLGASSYPSDGLSLRGRQLLLTPDEITYDELEGASGRRIVGYQESLRAQPASEVQARALGIFRRDPVLEVRRISRTTGAPISAFTFVGRSDRFEADYIIQA